MHHENMRKALPEKETYDRFAVGERIRVKRTLYGLTQETMAKKINRATNYYADIERGNCGMSVETLMAISASLNMPLDYIIYGADCSEQKEAQHTEEVEAIEVMLDGVDGQIRKGALDILKIMLSVSKN